MQQNMFIWFLSFLQITTVSQQVVTTTSTLATSSESTTVAMHSHRRRIRPSLKELESRYKFLIKEDERSRTATPGMNKKNRIPEIIRVAAEISRRRDRQSPKIISPQDGHVEATLVLEPRPQH